MGAQVTDCSTSRRDPSLVHAIESRLRRIRRLAGPREPRILLRAAFLITAASACLCALAACGDGGEREPRKQAPRVRVEITKPTDQATVRGANLDVRGAVSPARADVRVLGRPARVSGGTFTVVVPLEPAANIVDVVATARGRAPSLTAFRVTREQRVTVPDLGGRRLAELTALLTPLGLRLETESSGGLLDALIPGEPRVCEQQPAGGLKVRRGTTVRVTVARSC